MVAMDVEKVEKLTKTIMDFLYGTNLTNGEVDYVINTIWSKVMSDRIMYNVMAKLPPMMIVPIDDEEEKLDPNNRGPGIH